MNYKTTIILMSTELDLGDSLRVICPRCEGGSSNEKSLSISRLEDGDLVWQCFRANCPEKNGASDSGVSRISSVPKEIEKVRKVFKGTTKALTEVQLAQLNSMWGVTNPPYWYYTPDYGGRIAMSIRGPKYNHRGWVLRDIRGNARVKALTYLDKKEESLSWYKTHPDQPTVLVEDIPSAVRASRYVNSIALLGTAIGIGKALEIAEYGTRPIILALDQDATRQSFKHLTRYGLMWEDTRILTLPKDLKNMNEVELQEILNV